MASEPPTPPSNLPVDLIDSLNGLSPEQLQSISAYTDVLATYKSHAQEEQSGPNGDDGDEDGESADDLPEDVPAKATITIKEINDNRYYYWQWREGDKVKSRYKAPVSPDR